MANRGSCMTDPGWMTIMCPRSCSNCWLLDSHQRCTRGSLSIEQEAGLRPGDLEDRFQHMAETWPQYNVTVLSSSPWIVTFDNFLSDDEIKSVLDEVSGEFARSTDQGKIDER